MDENESMTLQELVAYVATILSEAALDQPSGRVSEVPSLRTVRYYASHGLLAKPVAWRGRSALYHMRHVLQLLAIKRLQAKGYALEDLQARITSSTDEQLAELAAWRPPAFQNAPDPPPVRARQDFWRTAP